MALRELIRHCHYLQELSGGGGRRLWLYRRLKSAEEEYVYQGLWRHKEERNGFASIQGGLTKNVPAWLIFNGHGREGPTCYLPVSNQKNSSEAE